ncbi:MAG: DUF2007 domain-containing protein [Bacteroidetes bacterium]|nr:DUF2007 domain-containing protein [Bacteroidota bacterium]
MPRVPEDHDSHWEVVFSTNLLYKAEIIKGMLEEEGIQCVLINKQDSSYIAFGDIDVLVPREEVLNSKQIMERAATNE